MHKKKKNRELLLEGSGATCKKPKPFGESVFALQYLISVCVTAALGLWAPFL